MNVGVKKESFNKKSLNGLVDVKFPWHTVINGLYTTKQKQHKTGGGGGGGGGGGTQNLQKLKKAILYKKSL